MAVSAAEPVNSEVTFDSQFHRVYTSTFKVQSDTVYESPYNVVDAPGVPTYRTVYQWPPVAPLYTDNWAFCSGATARLFSPQDRLLWLVTTKHESLRKTNKKPLHKPDNPLNEPPMWGGSFQLLDKYITRDILGNLMETTSEQPFPAYRIDDHRDNLIVEFNTATVNLQDRRDSIGKLNDAVFWGMPAAAVKLASWNIDIQYYGDADTPYVAHTMEFQFDFETFWRAERSNVSNKRLADAGSQDPAVRYADIVDADGTLIYLPLNGLGEPDPGLKPVGVQTYDIIETYDFTTLPCPQALPNPPFLPYV